MVPEYPEIDHGMFGAEFHYYERRQGGRGGNRQDDDKIGLKPVLPFSFVQNDLKGAEPHRQQRQSPFVNSELGAPYVVGVVYEEHCHQYRQDARRKIDVEDPSP